MWDASYLQSNSAERPHLNSSDTYLEVRVNYEIGHSRSRCTGHSLGAKRDTLSLRSGAVVLCCFAEDKFLSSRQAIDRARGAYVYVSQRTICYVPSLQG